ncbi:hypothetical protein J41TS4_21400 [Paenibacillus apis]|uniref:Amino acid permease/ SLC12A domain-containing protein n=1 Tax=Paenibacillus apis TaxID=1792174 RepID=A0A919Y5B4_9BACL|nr:hypothetical protein J41TS4_21400 [Paenibacillus apis]
MLPRVVKSFILRVILFYTLPILIICGLIPWNNLSEQTSPFVQVLTSAGMTGAAHLMNFILITAVLSAANSGIYGMTRMLHSMAIGGEAPSGLARLSSKGVPVRSLQWVAVLLITGSLIAYFAQDGLFRLLMAVPGFVVLLVAVLCLSVIAVLFLFDPQNRISIAVCLAVLGILTVWSILRFKKTGSPKLTS